MTTRTQLSLRGTGHTAAALDGGALIVTVMAVAVLCLIAGTLLSFSSSKQAGPFQAASWHEAGSAAEGGAEIALNALRRTITDGNEAAWSGWTSANGTTKKYITENDLLSHGGEGNTAVRAIVEISCPTGTGTINPPSVPSSRYAYLIRATGLANVPGPSRLALKKSDLSLRKINVFKDMRTNASITTPQITRVIEAIASPVTPFPAAIMSRDTIEIKGGSNMIIDSYNPKETPFKYDGSKVPGTIASRMTNGNIATNAKKKDNTDVIRLENVKVYGLAAKGNGVVNIKAPNASVSGEIIDGFYRELKPVQSPRNNPAFIPEGGLALDGLNRPHSQVNIFAGNGVGTTRYYKVSKIHLHKDDIVNIKKGGTGGGTAEIWVTGDVVIHKEGVINVEDGANVNIYAEKNVTLEEKDASHPAVKNNAVYPAPNPTPSGWTAFTNPAAFQVYGVVPDRHKKKVKIKTNLSGVVYAPDHEFEVKLKAGRHLYGALTGRKFKVESGTQVHYDESLSDVGKPFDYTLESWQEDWYDPKVRTVAVP